MRSMASPYLTHVFVLELVIGALLLLLGVAEPWAAITGFVCALGLVVGVLAMRWRS